MGERKGERGAEMREEKNGRRGEKERPISHVWDDDGQGEIKRMKESDRKM